MFVILTSNCSLRNEVVGSKEWVTGGLQCKRVCVLCACVCVCVCVRTHAQVCLTLCSPMYYSLLGSSARGIFQARILEWVYISFSRWSSRSMDQTVILVSPSLAGGFFTTSATWDALINGSLPIWPSCCLSWSPLPPKWRFHHAALQEQCLSLLMKSATASAISILGLSEIFTKLFFKDNSIPSPLKDMKSRGEKSM